MEFTAQSAALKGDIDVVQDHEDAQDTQEDAQEDGGEQFDDWSDAEEEEAVTSLFSSARLASVKELIQYDLEHTGFDLNSTVQAHCRDELDFIKLINFIRKHVSQGLQQAELADLIATKAFQDDQYMRPVLENDSLLYLFEEAFDFPEDDPAAEEVPANAKAQQTEEQIEAALDAIDHKGLE